MSLMGKFSMPAMEEYKSFKTSYETNKQEIIPENWQRLTKSLSETLQQLLTQTPEANASVAEELRAWLKATLEFLRWVESYAAELALMSVCAVVEFMLDAVAGLLTYCTKWKTEKSLAPNITETLALHNLVMKILNENLDNLEVGSVSEFAAVKKLITLLCDVGELNITMDLRILLETWRVAVKVTTYCSKWSQFATPCNGPAIEQNNCDKSWALRPFQFIFQQISRNLSAIYRKETLLKPLEHIERYLRVTNFYVKLLCRLVMEFKHEQFPASGDFLNTIILSKCIPSYLAGTKYGDSVQTYVSNALEQVFQAVYKSPVIFESILSDGGKKHSLLLITVYLRAVVADPDVKFIDMHCDAFVRMFQFLFTGAGIYIDKKSFMDIVVLYAGLSVLNSTKDLDHFFRRNVLIADFKMAHASTEVLLIIARSLPIESDSTELLQDFNFWRTCDEHFVLFSENYRRLNVRRLLQNVFDLCKKSKIIPEIKSLEGNLSDSSFLLYQAVGVDACLDNNSALHRVWTKLSQDLSKQLNKSEAGLCVKAFYDIVMKVILLSKVGVTPRKDLLDQLFDLVVRLYSEPAAYLKEQPLLMKVAFGLTSIYVESMPEASLQIILNFISNNAVRNLGSTVSALSFLGKCIKHPSEKIRSGAATIIKSFKCGAFKTVNAMLLDNPLVENKVPSTNEKIYDRLSGPNEGHTCKSPAKEIDAPPKKRLRLDEKGEEDLKLILSDMLKKSQDLLTCVEKVDRGDECTINLIVDNLHKVLQGNK